MGALALTNEDYPVEYAKENPLPKLRLVSSAFVEFDGNNNLLARYTHSGLRTDDVLAVDVTQAGVDQKLAQFTGAFEYLKDAQGTVTDVADTAGNKLQHYVYSAFGTLLGIQDANANEITNNPILNTAFTYTGREKDSESGYYYYRARYYDSQSGRFLQKDPNPGFLIDPATVVNSYAYAVNDPIHQTDPSGKSIFGEISMTLGKASGVISMVLGGVFGAYFNIQDGIDAKAPWWKIVISGVMGAAIGTGVAAAAIAGGVVGFALGGPAGAAIGFAVVGGAAAFAGGYINNYGNQLLFNGRVSPSRAARAGTSAFLTQTAGFGLDKLLGVGGAGEKVRSAVSGAASGAAGSCVDTGIPPEDPHKIAVCVSFGF